MARKRKAEGIALLSMYAASDDEEDGALPDSPGTPEPSSASPESNAKLEPQVAALDGLEIVDYAQDESALSPEGQEQLVDEPSPHEQDTDVQEATVNEEQASEIEEPKCTEPDYLKDFLPPPSSQNCGELQTKFAKYLTYKNNGRSFNEQLRNSKGYRNPDFLQRAVTHLRIDHLGSCFKKEIFDPHGYDATDFYDALALEQKRELERKEQERKQHQRVDFVRGNIPATASMLKPAIQIIHKVTSTSVEVSKQSDGRVSKKSKWDKVELEGKITSQSLSSTADAIAAANAHAALLTASANAGAGYASFAQQRRREAEEKLRISEKNAATSSSKLERKERS